MHFSSFWSLSLSCFFRWVESYRYKAFVIAGLGKKNPKSGSSRSALLKLFDCSSLSIGELKLRELMRINELETEFAMIALKTLSLNEFYGDKMSILIGDTMSMLIGDKL